MKTKLHYYYFNTDNATENAEYYALWNKLKGQGLKCFSSIAMNHSTHYKDHIKPLDGKTITLETDHFFSNQWNTTPTKTSESGLRVFDWAEPIYENKRIKEGQYLDMTQEMIDLQQNTLVCGYCGKHHANNGLKFCDKCLDCEYLKESDLHLLRLLPVSLRLPKRPELSEVELNELKPLYVTAQTVATGSRAVAKRNKQYRDIKARFDKDTENAKDEYEGFKWLLDHNVNIDNCIFYDHTRRFCFGWRNPLSESVKSALLDTLCEFHFDYDLK